MEIANLIQWAIGILVVVLSGAWGRLNAKVSKNNEATAVLRAEIAEVRGKQDAQAVQLQVLLEEIRNTHQRIGGVASTTNRIDGKVDAMTNIMTPIFEHLLERERAS